MSPKRTEKKVGRRALEAAAEERAVVRASIAATTVQLRLLHALVPVASSLEVLEALLGVLKIVGFFRKQHVDAATDLVDRMERMAREAGAEIHQQADGLGYPLTEEIERFRQMNAGLATLTQMRQTLVSLEAGDWDVWLDDLHTEGEDDEQ